MLSFVYVIVMGAYIAIGSMYCGAAPGHCKPHEVDPTPTPTAVATPEAR